MEILLSSFISPLLTGLVTGLVIFRLQNRKTKKGRRKPAKKQQARAMNAQAVNSVVEHQKIRTAEIEIPVIAEDVLTYEGGELGSSYPDKTRLYYPADAISDPEYLETVLRSPLQVQTHQKNTGEFNRDVDGWPTKAWWDAADKRVMLKGVLHGEENVKYAEENKNLPGFGTSAFISFLRIEKTPGTAPNGKPYDAIVRKAVNNHVAILPNVRDPRNVIVAMNAVEGEEKHVDVANPSWVADEGTWERAKKAADKGDYDEYYAVVTDIYKKLGGKIAHGSNGMPIDKGEFKSAMQAFMAEEKEEADKAERIKNAIKNELKEESSKTSGPASSGPVTSTATGGNAGTSTSTGTAGNGTESSGPESARTAPGKKTETATASNAIPSEEMVKDFSTHLGVTFPKAPSLDELASLVGIKATEPFELISALNAKREEFKSRTSGSTEAQNSNPSLGDLMRTI